MGNETCGDRVDIFILTPNITSSRYYLEIKRSYQMKTMTMVYFKPKPEYFDQFVAALKNGAKNSYVLTRDDEVMEVWLKDSIDELAEQQPSALSWLDRHRYMLQEYSADEGHTRPFTAFVEQEPAYLTKSE